MMKKLLSAAIISFAIAAPAYAQDARPATTAPAAVTAPKATAPVAAAPATTTTPAVKAPMAAAPATATKATAAAPAPVKKVAVKLTNLNTATSKELDDLPKIGAARTKSIIAGRPYKTVQDLLDKKIVPKDAYDAIKDKVSVN